MLKSGNTKRRVFIFLLGIITIFVVYLVIRGDDTSFYEKEENMNIQLGQ